MSRIIYKQNVLEKAQERIRYAFDDFPVIACTFSGGKDSAVCLHLTLAEAERRNKKVYLVFLDQEAEWQATIDEIRRWMYHPNIIPVWGQFPFILENSAGILNEESHYLLTYDPEKKDKWIHPQDPCAFTTLQSWCHDAVLQGKANGKELVEFRGNVYPNFYLGLEILPDFAIPEGDYCLIGGIRANEAMGRLQMCTHKLYRNINGTFIWKRQRYPMNKLVRLHPIYDWKGSDVWKYIYDNKVPHNALYNRMYQQGITHRGMRISSVCHEMALSSIMTLAELEPDTWGRIQRRLGGTNTTRTLGEDANCCPKKFPPMFKSWDDYRDYLFETLIPEDKKPALAKTLARCNRWYNTKYHIRAVQTQIDSILICDIYGVYIERFLESVSNKEKMESGSIGKKYAEEMEYAKQQGITVVT